MFENEPFSTKLIMNDVKLNNLILFSLKKNIINIISPNTTLFGAQSWNDDQPKRSKHDVSKLSHLPFVQTQPMGRFGAKKPTGSMAEVPFDNNNT